MDFVYITLFYKFCLYLALIKNECTCKDYLFVCY